MTNKLTDEQLDQIVYDCGLSRTPRDIARAIEAAIAQPVQPADRQLRQGDASMPVAGWVNPSGVARTSKWLDDDAPLIRLSDAQAALAAKDVEIADAALWFEDLEEEVERLKKASIRYQWLRKGGGSNRVPHLAQYPAQEFDNPKMVQAADVGWDAAIAAAMTQEVKP